MKQVLTHCNSLNLKGSLPHWPGVMPAFDAPPDRPRPKEGEVDGRSGGGASHSHGVMDAKETVTTQGAWRGNSAYSDAARGSGGEEGGSADPR